MKLPQEKRLVRNVVYANWAVLIIASVAGLCLSSLPFALGIMAGGLITVVNFHLLSKTLALALDPRVLAGQGSVVAKYYFRFVISGVIILGLLKFNMVHPLGLFVGLSVVVAGMASALVLELKYVFNKEAS